MGSACSGLLSVSLSSFVLNVNYPLWLLAPPSHQPLLSLPVLSFGHKKRETNLSFSIQVLKFQGRNLIGLVKSGAYP